MTDNYRYPLWWRRNRIVDRHCNGLNRSPSLDGVNNFGAVADYRAPEADRRGQSG